MSYKPTIPAAIRDFVQSRSQGRFLTSSEANEYMGGFSEGFKSSLLNKSPQLQQFSGSQARDTGFEDGRSTGLSNPMPEALAEISLYSYDYTQQTTKGLIYFNFEQHDFRLLKAPEIWWVAGGFDQFEAYRALCRDIPPLEQRYSTFARLKALVSSSGMFGHFGSYERELCVLEVLEIRRATPQETRHRKELEQQS